MALQVLTQIVALQKILSGLPQAEYLWVLKLCVFLVLLVNAGSLPFAWHRRSARVFDSWKLSSKFLSTVRVFWPVIVFRISFFLLRAILLFKSPAERKWILAERIEALCPIGANPFEFVTVHRRWASMFRVLTWRLLEFALIWLCVLGIDDTDMFGLHLSNSSYAKVRLNYWSPFCL